MTKRIISFLMLFSSLSTLVCCALPALFVSLGFGATLIGVLGAFPQLIWLSEHKTLVFSTAGTLLLAAGCLRIQARKMACPIDDERALTCMEARKLSSGVFWFSLCAFLVGGFFAFVAPRLG